MVTIRECKTEDIKTILSWNESTEAFLKQWSNFTYPLAEEQYIDRINSEDFYVFSIEHDGTLAGTVQIYRIDKEKRTARVGCYLINPQMRGKGIGTSALDLLSAYAFKNMEVDTLESSVFDYNVGAIKCYQKVGFVKTGEFQHPMGWTGYTMSKSSARRIE